MRRLIRALDRSLIRRLGLLELSEATGSVLRVRVIAAPRPVHLPGRRLPAGARVLELHLWNERIPPLPDGGPTLAWGVKFHRLVVSSFRALAARLVDDPRLAGVAAVGGVTFLAATADGPWAAEGLRRLGFALAPHRGRLGRLGELCESAHCWLVMWAFGASGRPRRRLRRLRQSDFWSSTEEFLRRYTRPAAQRSPHQAPLEPGCVRPGDPLESGTER